MDLAHARLPDRLFPKMKRTLAYIALIISLLGLVTFSLFIMEEALQVTMFGTWPAQDAGDWETVREGIDLMESLNLTLKILTYTIGWIQPLAFISYRSYAKSTDYYIKALKVKTFARAPEVFDGRKITFNFKPTRVVFQQNDVRLIHRKIIVILKDPEWISFMFQAKTKGVNFQITGKVEAKGNKILIHATKIARNGEKK